MTKIDIGRDAGDLVQLRLDPLDHRDGVRAALAADLEGDGRLAVQAGGGPLLLGAVLGLADVLHPDGLPIHGSDDQVVEGARGGKAAHGAERLLPPGTGHLPAGDVGVLRAMASRTAVDRQLVGGNVLGVHQTLTCAPPAPDPHLPTPSDRSICLLHDLSAISVSSRTWRSPESERQYRLALVVELVDDRRVHVLRQPVQHGALGPARPGRPRPRRGAG